MYCILYRLHVHILWTSNHKSYREIIPAEHTSIVWDVLYLHWSGWHTITYDLKKFFIQSVHQHNVKKSLYIGMNIEIHENVWSILHLTLQNKFSQIYLWFYDNMNILFSLKREYDTVRCECIVWKRWIQRFIYIEK